MVQLGWMADSHCRPNGNGVASSTFRSDYDYLTETKGVDDVYFTGDLVHPDSGYDVPHTPMECYTTFWNIFQGVNQPDKLAGYLPGNHEVPIQGLFASEFADHAVLSERWDYGGVTVCTLDTTAPGRVTGSPGNSKFGGTGVNEPRVPQADIDWLDEQLADAGSNAKVVLPHAAVYVTDQGEHGYSYKQTRQEDQKYWLCENYDEVHNVLKKYNKVVVPTSHLYHSSRGARNWDGVDYCWKHHYWYNGSATTFGHIDITSTGCTVTTIESGTRTEHTILDVTF